MDIFKYHFIASLSIINPYFLLHLWCRLLTLETITLNLKLPSRINPALSPCELLILVFDYNKTPLAPPGTKVTVHDASTKRKTCTTNGTEGWNIGTAPNHCRCHKIYIMSTKDEPVSNTVKFLPHETSLTQKIILEEAISATNKLVDTL